ncbi:hypothetical protein V0R37_15070 [Pollutimonas sp. H1-120]|uniref:hypothetical protein n=1 Tax=Pollutimonas sp. H1-120 TaxID=3148824 RepID=UPI003B51C575
MKLKKFVCATLLLSATTAYADICADMNNSTAGAVAQRQQEIDKDPRFEEIERQRRADQECMLDLSKELGDVVSADGYGLGAIIDDVFKQVSASICNVQNNPARQHAGFGGSVAKAPQSVTAPRSEPSITGAQPFSSPLATPPVVQQPASNPSSSTSSVWTRLNEAMAGRPINK